jgi:AcrR family transcriptional regulator
MAAKTTPEEKFLATALIEIERNGWSTLSLAALARQSKISASALHEFCPDKRALIGLITKRADIALLERTDEPEMDAPARDRAFDAILNWFEGLAPARGALAVIHKENEGSIGTIIDVMPATTRSAHWIVDNANLSATGWEGLLVTRGLGLLLAETLGVWIKDDGDLAKTMAHLDRRLRTMEEWLSTLNRFKNAGGQADTD